MVGLVNAPLRPRQMKFGVFMIGDSNYHVAGWRDPQAVADAGSNFGRWIEFARVLEDAKIDMLFLADTPGVMGFDNKDTLRASSKSERFEPFTLLSALSVVTEKLGLAATGTTTYSEPFNLARTVASLDLLSGGRAAWNVVTGGNPEDATNFSLDKQVPSSERYARGEEFVDVVLGLWDSVEPEAFPRDKSTGAYADPTKIHAINHKGKYYAVKGPLSVQPSAQGRPVVIQAGQSEEGRDLAARVADVVFTNALTLAGAQAFYADMQARITRKGRSTDAVKILPGISITVGRTEAEADAKERALENLMDLDVALTKLSIYLGGIDLSGYSLDAPAPEFAVNEARGGTTPMLNELSRSQGLTLRQLAYRVGAGGFHLTLKGTPTQVADTLEAWFRQGAADGFNLIPNVVPGSIVDFAELVAPELRRRGLFREDYEGSTLRENLGIDRPEAGWSRHQST